MPLNERECRRPDFRGGVEVEMADGQSWWVVRPEKLYRPDDGEAGFELLFDLGDEYQSLYQALLDAKTVSSIIKAFMDCVKYLLGLNYTLDSTAHKQLLAVSFAMLDREDEQPRTSHEERFAILRDIALGNEPAPKVLVAGSD